MKQLNKLRLIEDSVNSRMGIKTKKPDIELIREIMVYLSINYVTSSIPKLNKYFPFDAYPYYVESYRNYRKSSGFRRLLGECEKSFLFKLKIFSKIDESIGNQIFTIKLIKNNLTEEDGKIFITLKSKL